MDTVGALSKQLSRQNTHLQTLHSLLQLSAKGIDISASAECVVQRVLYSASGTTPQLLSLALDTLTASPAHAFWPDVISVIAENLARSGTAACLTALSKVPTLPHAALQHLVLVASAPLAHAISNDKSPAIRRAAAHAVAAITLRPKPLTAFAVEAVRLEPLSKDQLNGLRHAVEKLLYALLKAVFDPADEVAVSALSLLTSFSLDADSALETSLLNATREATAMATWDVLLPNCRKIADRFAPVCAKLPDANGKPAEQATPYNMSAPQRAAIKYRKEGLKSMARLAARALSDKYSKTERVTEGDQFFAQAAPQAQVDEEVRQWSVAWVDRVLAQKCDSGVAEVAAAACSALVMVCSFAVQNPSLEKVAQWGIRSVRRLSRILVEQDEDMSMIIMTGLVQDSSHGLAALSKNDYVTSKFIVATAVGLIPFAAKCARREVRLEVLSVISSTIVEYDLSGRDAGIGVSLKAVLASESWKGAMSSSQSDSNVPSEMVCCFAQSLLEASRKIFVCQDAQLRLNLTHTWAVMLSQLMSRIHICLSWTYSPASLYARELFLKLFDALGQYSSYLQRSQNIGMEEYERLQEMMVKLTLDQEDAGTRASLLAAVTRYWLTSGMKAEANTGHVLKAIWKHAQEHYQDEDIILKELRTGALWSDARKGLKTPAARSVEGGYVSIATAFSKRTRAAIDTVGNTVTTAIEETLFGSIALATAAAEGSTLTTDFAYSSWSALLALVGHNPGIAEKGLKLLRKYITIMEEAESSDFIALEAVRNAVASVEMYEDEFFPKTVPVRDLSSQHRREDRDALAWLGDITQSCVFATSRLEDPLRESSTVSTEESVLHSAVVTKLRMRAFSIATMQTFDARSSLAIEGDRQTLNGASDPFSVVASHSMDTVKGLALVRVEVINRSAFKAINASLTFASSGALAPMPDAANSFPLGAMAPGVSVAQRITFTVRKGQGYAGRVFFAIQTRGDGDGYGNPEEQTCIPYYIPSSDVLLLRPPASNAGMDVFRRRWDLMRCSTSLHLFIRKDQSVDLLVDALERRSKCLKEVGRMRTYSHVCALVADSSRGDYVAVAGVAPEANGSAGIGPCVLYVTIRSNSDAYNRAFRDECREWLTTQYRVIFPDEPLNREDEALALKPQDAFFITGSQANLSPYQRWRKAHASRVRY